MTRINKDARASMILRVIDEAENSPLSINQYFKEKDTLFGGHNIIFMWNIIHLPVRVKLADNRKECLIKEFLHVIKSFAYITGMLKGYCFENYPREKVINERLDFLRVWDEIKLRLKIRKKIKGM